MILPYQIFQKFNIYLEYFIRKMNNKIIVMNIVRKKINIHLKEKLRKIIEIKKNIKIWVRVNYFN